MSFKSTIISAKPSLRIPAIATCGVHWTSSLSRDLMATITASC